MKAKGVFRNHSHNCYTLYLPVCSLVTESCKAVNNNLQLPDSPTANGVVLYRRHTDGIRCCYCLCFHLLSTILTFHSASVTCLQMDRATGPYWRVFREEKYWDINTLRTPMAVTSDLPRHKVVFHRRRSKRPLPHQCMWVYNAGPVICIPVISPTWCCAHQSCLGEVSWKAVSN